MLLHYDCRHSPEKYRNLWNAVLLQLTKDFVTRSVTTPAQFHKSQADCWFNPHNKDFRMLCDIVGMDPDEVYRRALIAKKKNFKFRLENGAGARYQRRPGPSVTADLTDL